MVDTIGLSIPLEPAEWSAIAPLYSRTIREDKVRRGVVRSWLDRHNYRLRLEFSAPTIMNGHNILTLDATQTMEVIADVISALCTNLDIRADRLRELQVSRLDLCRDLTVEDPSGYIWQMCLNYRSTQRAPKTIMSSYDENGFRSFSLYAQRRRKGASARRQAGSSSAQIIRCYDKAAEIERTFGSENPLVLAAAGIVRCEVTLRGNSLSNHLRRYAGRPIERLRRLLRLGGVGVLAKKLQPLVCSEKGSLLADLADGLIDHGRSATKILRAIGLMHMVDKLGFDETCRKLGVTSRETKRTLHKELQLARRIANENSHRGSPGADDFTHY